MVAYTLGLVGALNSYAGIKWAASERNLTADPAKSEIAATFDFVNEGPDAVAILEVTTTCGCTSAQADQRVYAPGATGRIDVVLRYDPANASTSQRVVVTTDERPARPRTLIINVTVPGGRPSFERIEVRPQFLLWTRGTPATARTVALRVRPDDAIRPLSVTSTDPAFAVQLLDPLPEAPQVFRLLVTPRDTAQARQSEIVVVTNSDSFQPPWMHEPPLHYRVVAAVK